MRRLLKNKKIVFVSGERKKEATEAIDFVLKSEFSTLKTRGIPGLFSFFPILRSEVIIIEENLTEPVEKIKKLFSSNFLFLVTETKKKKRIKELISRFPEEGILVMHYSKHRKIKSKIFKKFITFAIARKSADFYISDIKRGEKEINFKVNYKGNIVPFWVAKNTKKEEIYAILSAICIGVIFQLNLAEMSSRIREKYQKKL